MPTFELYRVYPALLAANVLGVGSNAYPHPEIAARARLEGPGIAFVPVFLNLRSDHPQFSRVRLQSLFRQLRRTGWVRCLYMQS